MKNKETNLTQQEVKQDEGERVQANISRQELPGVLVGAGCLTADHWEIRKALLGYSVLKNREILAYFRRFEDASDYVDTQFANYIASYRNG